MARARLHMGVDAGSEVVQATLVDRGHDVTRAPTSWMPIDAGPEFQLLATTAHGRIPFAFNIQDFVALGAQYPQHAGIVLAAQANWKRSDLAAALDRLLSGAEAERWVGRVRWLTDWRPGARAAGAETATQALLRLAERQIAARGAEREVKREPVESSGLKTVAYDPNTGSLEIAFRHGSIYRYYNVPYAVYHELMTADSMGRYFVKHIRDRYHYALLA